MDRTKLDETALSQAAVKAMVTALDDPYSSYLDPQTYKLNVSTLEGEFGGIGAQVEASDKQIKVIAALPGSPAEKAGVKAGDVILQIDGVSTEGMSVNDAVLKIRGVEGTSVKLLLQREGEPKPIEISILRQKITLDSVRWVKKGDFALVTISHFSSRTGQELSPVLKEVNDSGAKGIILDLRHDPGGSLDAVIDVASHFLSDGVVVSVVDNKQNRTVHKVREEGLKVTLPVVVLVDSFSASGSEVLAGALQDQKRAVIAGTKTFGKGSVNILRQLKDGSGIYITTARWLTPNGRLIEGKGIDPDYLLELSGDDLVQWAMDFLNGRAA